MQSHYRLGLQPPMNFEDTIQFIVQFYCSSCSLLFWGLEVKGTIQSQPQPFTMLNNILLCSGRQSFNIDCKDIERCSFGKPEFCRMLLIVLIAPGPVGGSGKGVKYLLHSFHSLKQEEMLCLMGKTSIGYTLVFLHQVPIALQLEMPSRY